MQKGSLNKAQLIGHVGNDPESKFTKSGNAVTNFSLATNESWKDKNDEVQERTEWHRIVMFGKMAETAGEYLTKGQLVYVEGRIKTDSWETDSGEKRYSTSITADVFTMLGKKEPKNSNDAEREAANEDDLPF